MGSPPLPRSISAETTMYPPPARTRIAARIGTHQERRARPAPGSVPMGLSIFLEEDSRETRLPDDRLKCANSELGVIGHRYGSCRLAGAQLHHNMATPTSDLLVSVTCENPAHLMPGENAQLT